MNYSTDGQLLLTASDDKTLKVFRTDEKKFQFSLVGHKNWVRVGVFAPDSRLIASGGDDKTIFMWDTETKNVVTQYHDHLGIIYDAKFNPDGTCLASCSQDRKIKIFDMRAKRQIQHYDAHGDTILKIDFHPRSSYLISSSADSKLKVTIELKQIWDLRKGTLAYTLYGHNGSTNACAFSKQGDYFVSGGNDAMVLLWRSNLYPNQNEYI